MNVDRISAVLFLALSVFIYSYAAQYQHLSSFFPQVVAVIMGIFAISLLIKSFISPEISDLFKNIDKKYLAIFAVGLIAYILLVPVIGFLVGSILFICLFCWLLGHDKNNKKIIISSLILGIGVSSIFYGVFTIIFKVPFPTGIFFGA